MWRTHLRWCSASLTETFKKAAANGPEQVRRKRFDQPRRQPDVSPETGRDPVPQFDEHRTAEHGVNYLLQL
jgi:hypothetical protein